MKNLLNLLAVAVLGSTTVVPNIVVNPMLVNQYQNINLPITRIAQEQSTYCLPATIQMIFAFNGISLASFSQDQIYEDLDGYEGIPLDSEVTDYLNEHTPRNYAINRLRRNFGANIQEQWVFQNYVHSSLSHDYPLMFAFRLPNSRYDHVVLITGITPNWQNPTLTEYTYLDPARNSAGTIHITGNDLSSILYDGGAIVGEGKNPDFKKKGISIGINNREVGEDRLNDYEDHEVSRIRTDLTATTGATSTGNFANMIDSISLPNFNGEIYNFTWRKPVKSFSIDTKNIPENNDSWLGPKIVIESSREDDGSAHIEGRIIGQIQFERTKSLNHLLMYLVIYVGGISWSSPNWAHVWFETGNVLNFSKK